MADLPSDPDRAVRRLRKKLRQIEHLETIGRDLNDEETAKVGKKQETRAELAKIIAAMKRRSAGEETGTVEVAATRESTTPKKQRRGVGNLDTGGSGRFRGAGHQSGRLHPYLGSHT